MKKNNFYQNEKDSTIYTPESIAVDLMKILNKEIKAKNKEKILIFDPCVGSGRLLQPWKEKGYKVLGWDIKNQGFPETDVKDYLEIKKEDITFKPDIVVINPPFNFSDSMKNQAKSMGFSSRPLIPEVFLKKTIDLFGENQVIALFTPYGLRLNNGTDASRLKKFIDGEYPAITGIISLPKDIYDDVLFHSEILLFNTQKNAPHYFLRKEIK